MTNLSDEYIGYMNTYKFTSFTKKSKSYFLGFNYSNLVNACYPRNFQSQWQFFNAPSWKSRMGCNKFIKGILHCLGFFFLPIKELAKCSTVAARSVVYDGERPAEV